MKRSKVRPTQRDASTIDGPWGTRPERGRKASSRGFVLMTAVLAAAAFFGTFGSDRLSVDEVASELRRDQTVIDQVRTSASAQPDTLIGRATIIDGDTIEISGERIRLNGIDAPEAKQLCNDSRGKSYRCGAESARALEKLLAASRPTECRFVERDQYGRFVGDCYRADGQNVAAMLVRSGHALDWPKHSGGAYAADQHVAQAQKLGLWRGTFVEPWAWRAEQRQKPQETSQRPVGLLSSGKDASTGCRIKGNISSKGERIYHVPGQRYYDQTKISPNKGERWFCSEAEARSAGWRRSKV